MTDGAGLHQRLPCLAFSGALVRQMCTCALHLPINLSWGPATRPVGCCCFSQSNAPAAAFVTYLRSWNPVHVLAGHAGVRGLMEMPAGALRTTCRSRSCRSSKTRARPGPPMGRAGARGPRTSVRRWVKGVGEGQEHLNPHGPLHTDQQHPAEEPLGCHAHKCPHTHTHTHTHTCTHMHTRAASAASASTPRPLVSCILLEGHGASTGTRTHGLCSAPAACPQISRILLESPEVVAVDEAHEMRNPSTNFCNAIKRVRTKRRIALTGYPLQVRRHPQCR